MKTAYYETQITPAHSGFGEYQRGEDQYSPQMAWADENDLLKEIDGDFEIIDDALQSERFINAGVEDIRGKIHGGNPEELYAILNETEGYVNYFGIESIEVPDDYWN